MVPVILALHSLIILALIGVVLLQRSEGGAVLSGGSFMTGRGTANALTRTTSILAALFFTTSMALALIAARGEKDRSVIEELTGVPAGGRTPTTTDDLLKSLGAEEEQAAPTPAPAATPPPAAAPQEAPSAAETAPAPAPAGDAPSEEPAPEEQPSQPQ
jgi:preprotein translocase subunit SecG